MMTGGIESRDIGNVVDGVHGVFIVLCFRLKEETISTIIATIKQLHFSPPGV